MLDARPSFPIALPRDTGLRREITEGLDLFITPEKILHFFKKLQEPAPSGTEIYTRTPHLVKMLQGSGVVREEEIDSNFRDTESLAVFMNHLPRKVVVNFQMDDISYLPWERTNEEEFRLRPNHAQRQKPSLSFSGAILRYNEEEEFYRVFSIGFIVTDYKGDAWYLRSQVGQQEHVPGQEFTPVSDRVVYTPGVEYFPKTNKLTGKVDNQAGMATGLVALDAAVNASICTGIPINVGLLFTGEEEGIPSQHDSFSRQARRVANSLSWSELPNLVINVDGHDVHSLPPVAVWGEQVSDCVGPVAPPHQATQFRRLLEDLKEYGVETGNTYELGGRISRSDDVGWMGRVRTLALGYPGKDFHFVEDVPSTNLTALVNLAKSLAWIYLSARAN